MKKWLDERILFFAWSFILLICFIIILTSPVKAADVTDTLTFPLRFEDAHALNNWYSDSYQVLLSDENVGPLMNDSDYIIVPIDLSYYGYWDNWSWWFLTIIAVPVEDFPTVYPNSLLSQTSIQANYVSGKQSYLFQLWIDERGNNPTHIDSFQEYTPNDREYFGARNSQTFYNYTFISGYPIFWGKDFYSVNDTQILLYTESAPTQGHATPPDLTGDDIGSDKPDIDDYIPILPNKPTIDNSSLESLVESLIDLIDWQFSAITGTLKGLIKYLGDTITYSIQKVIDNIKNSMQNFYDNMKSLFEPLLNSINEILSSISSGIDYIKEPLSGSAIYDNLSGTGIMTNYNATVTAVNSFKDSFTNLNEPSTFTIPIHLEELPSSMFGDLTTQYIDLSVINSVKPILRTFVWALVTYGLIITIFDSIANYINGGGDE